MVKLNLDFQAQHGRLVTSEALVKDDRKDKSGIKTYNKFLGFILSIFCKVRKIEITEKGKASVVYVNKKSYDQWLDRVMANIPKRDQTNVEAKLNQIFGKKQADIYRTKKNKALEPFQKGAEPLLKKIEEEIVSYAYELENELKGKSLTQMMEVKDLNKFFSNLYITVTEVEEN